MDAKKQIKSYIGAQAWLLILGIVLLAGSIALLDVLNEVAPLLMMIGFFILLYCMVRVIPAMVASGGALKQLESRGLLEKAAAELSSPTAQVLCKGRITVTDHFLFAKNSGIVCYYGDILWTYKHSFTQRLLFIPIYRADSLVVKTAKKGYNLAAGGRDKADDLRKVMVRIYQGNPQVLVGYTPDTIKTYKQLRKQNR